METRQKTKDLKKCWRELDSIVPTIDKIGSGFEDTEKAALALFLYFKEEEVLDRLAYIRSYCCPVNFQTAQESSPKPFRIGLRGFIFKKQAP